MKRQGKGRKDETKLQQASNLCKKCRLPSSVRIQRTNGTTVEILRILVQQKGRDRQRQKQTDRET